MEERSLRVVGTDKTFFNTNTLTKLLIPTQIGINGMRIGMKRNALIKAYEATRDEDIEPSKKEIVEKNIENPDFNIEQLASGVCMGRSAFFEKIKDITGTTPANFILECRLNKATALLIKNPTLRMDDIAAYLGFSSGRYFCKCFKNHFGISPLQYRKQDQG